MVIIINMLKAFTIGGVFCLIGQLLIDKTNLTPARILTGYVVAGVILGALNIYEPIVNYAGAGATVPLTGFGYLLYKGTKEAVDAHSVIGILSGGLTACAAGITAAIFFSFVFSLFFKSKDKSK